MQAATIRTASPTMRRLRADEAACVCIATVAASSCISHPPDDAAAEQTGGAHDENADDQHQREGQLELGADDVRTEQILQDTNDEPAEHGTRRVVDAADQ